MFSYEGILPLYMYIAPKKITKGVKCGSNSRSSVTECNARNIKAAHAL